MKTVSILDETSIDQVVVCLNYAPSGHRDMVTADVNDDTDVITFVVDFESYSLGQIEQYEAQYVEEDRYEEDYEEFSDKEEVAYQLTARVRDLGVSSLYDVQVIFV